jgi:nitrate reductase NapAB chaperone NapD
MPVSGLVITLESSEAEASVRRALALEQGVVLGECTGRHLAVAVDSATLREGERAFERLRELPSVLAVDVVFVDFSDAGLGPDEGCD